MKRETMLLACKEFFPDLYPYAYAAYGDHSWLIHGDFIIHSCSGAQQGDPLGPFLFSLGLCAILKKCKGFTKRVKFHAWYMDDGTFVAKKTEAKAAFDELRKAMATHSMDFNLGKCEAIAHDSTDAQALFPDWMGSVDDRPTLAKWELLGLPCGVDAGLRAQYVREKLKSSIEATTKIKGLGHTQCMYLLLRYCVCQMPGYYARAVGPCDPFKE